MKLVCKSSNHSHFKQSTQPANGAQIASSSVMELGTKFRNSSRQMALLLLILVVGCGPDSSKHSSQPKAAAETALSAPAPGTPADIAAKVNNGTLGLGDGVSHLALYLNQLEEDFANEAPDFSEGNGAENNSTANASSSPITQATTVADAVIQITQGNEASNLKAVLGVDVQSTDLSQSDWDALFSKLSDHSLGPVHDHFLLYYSQMKRKQIEDKLFDTQSLFAPYPFTSALNYFSGQVELKLQILSQNPAHSLSASQIWNIYGGIEELAMDSHYSPQLRTTMAQLASQTDVSEMRPAARSSFLFWVKAQSESHIPAEMKVATLTNLLKVAQAEVRQLKASSATFTQAVRALDTMNAAFDFGSEHISGVDFDVWIKMLDQRTMQVMIPFQESLDRKALEEVAKIQKGANFHPYTQLYYLRALIEAGLDDLPKKMATHPDDISLLSSVSSAVNAYASNLDAGRRDTDAGLRSLYQWKFYSVEFRRQFIELNSLNSRAASDKNDIRVQAYARIYDDLNQALDLRYRARLASGGSRSDQNADTNYINSLRSIANEGTENANHMSLKIGRVDLKPGIFESDVDVEIAGESLNFHPLSMIIAKGRSVRLSVKQVRSPWIDTSAPEFALSPQPQAILPDYQRPVIGMSGHTFLVPAYQKTAGCLEYKPVTPIGPLERTNPPCIRPLIIHDCDREIPGLFGLSQLPIRATDEIYYKQGSFDYCKADKQLPTLLRAGTPVNGASGRSGMNAGNINLNEVQSIHGLPLLAGTGGDGQQGQQGSNSYFGSPQKIYVTPGLDDDRNVINQDRKNDAIRNFGLNSLSTSYFESFATNYSERPGLGGQGGNGGNGASIVYSSSAPRFMWQIALVPGGRSGSGASSGSAPNFPTQRAPSGALGNSGMISAP